MKKELVILASIITFSIGCSTSPQDLRRTQVVTFPSGGIVEYNGKRLGQEPVLITLPQDEKGNLAARAVIRASPSERMTLAETRILDPGERIDRVPDRIMLDISSHVEVNSGSQANIDTGTGEAKTQARKRAESPRGRSQR
ncbi:MAG: hypothetical protein ACO1QB_08055 [Verrucomicrobiales bacterium]